MKKLFALVLALTMVLTMSACGSKKDDTEDEENSQVVNPMVEYTSLEEVNEIGNVNLCAPQVDGILNESFFIIDDTIIDYRFTMGDVDYIFRASHDLENDISGIYSGDGFLLDSMDADGYAADDTCKVIQWTISEDGVDTQYVLIANDNGTMDEASFKALAAELQPMTFSTMSEEDAIKQLYETLAGEYSDDTSKRATASVVNEGDDISIVVEWASSSSEKTVWNMRATYDAQAGLIYNDGTETTVTTASDGTETETVVSENGNGYFVISSTGNLLWEGAENENCRDCVFVRVQ